MPNLEDKIKNMPLEDFPKSLHEKIMLNAFYLKFRTPLLFITSLLFLNLFLSGWHAWARMASLETLSALASAFDSFEMSFTFFSDLSQIISESVPLATICVFAINALVAVFAAKILFNLQKEKRSSFKLKNY